MGITVGLGPVAPYLLGALGPLVVDELDLTRGQFGSLWLVSFGAAVTLSLIAGHISDRLGPRRAMAVVLALGTLGLLTLGFAHTFWWVVAGLVLSGAAQSGSGASTNLGVIAYVEPERRSVAVGIKQAAVQVGQLVAGLLAPLLALMAAWRTGFLLLALMGISGLIGVLRLAPDSSPTADRSTQCKAAGSGRLPRALVALIVHAALTGVVLQATNVYLPLFAHDELHFAPAVAGLMTAALGAVGVLARLAWARRLRGQHGSMGRLRSGLSLATIGAVCLTALSPTVARLTDSGAAGVTMLLLGVAAFGVSAMAATLVVIIEVLSVVPGRVGWASSYVTLGMMSGFMIGPPLFGAFIDLTGGYALSWLTLAVVALVQWILNELLERGVKRV